MGTLEDFQNFGRELQKELDRLDQFAEADRPHVKRYITKKDGEVTDGTLAVYLRNLRMTAGRLDRPLVDLDEATFDAHTYDLRHGDYGRGSGGLSNDTIRNIEFAVRSFLTTVDVEAEWADDYEISSPSEPKVRPEDMLRAEDINALTDGAQNLRDVALVEFLADTGVRLSLAGSLRVGDLDLEGPKATYRPNPNASGLKGAAIREYPIIDSKAILRTYLQTVHPRPDDDEVAFFHKLSGHGNQINGDGALSPNGIRGQLQDAADRAGVEKPVNPHNFRHSAITRMRREGYDRGEVESRVHWTVDSDMWKTYEHIAGEQHNEAIWERAGVADSPDGPEPERRPCGNCMEPIPPHRDFCGACGAPASKRAREAHDAAKRTTTDEMARADDPERRLDLSTLLEMIRSHPEFVAPDHEDPSNSS